MIEKRGGLRIEFFRIVIVCLFLVVDIKMRVIGSIVFALFSVVVEWRM